MKQISRIKKEILDFLKENPDLDPTNDLYDYRLEHLIRERFFRENEIELAIKKERERIIKYYSEKNYPVFFEPDLTDRDIKMILKGVKAVVGEIKNDKS